MDPDFWNVISLREPSRPRPNFSDFPASHSTICYDVMETDGMEESELIHAPSAAHLKEILRFAEQTGKGPLLIHCWAGVSRSTAVALVLIVHGMFREGLPEDRMIEEAAETILTIRGCAAPNPLILGIGLNELLPLDLAERVTKGLLNHPELLANRRKGASPDGRA
jgi:predicted protein tyrosine phosphatase